LANLYAVVVNRDHVGDRGELYYRACRWNRKSSRDAGERTVVQAEHPAVAAEVVQPDVAIDLT